MTLPSSGTHNYEIRTTLAWTADYHMLPSSGYLLVSPNLSTSLGFHIIPLLPLSLVFVVDNML